MARARLGQPARLDRWTPKRAADFARTRVDRIKLALMEIAVAYDEVDPGIGWACDRLRDDIDHESEGLLALIKDAETEGRTP